MIVIGNERCGAPFQNWNSAFSAGAEILSNPGAADGSHSDKSFNTSSSSTSIDSSELTTRGEVMRGKMPLGELLGSAKEELREKSVKTLAKTVAHLLQLLYEIDN